MIALKPEKFLNTLVNILNIVIKEYKIANSITTLKISQ